MFVLLGIVFADDEVRDVRGEVVLVETAEFEDLGGEVCLRRGVS